MYVRSDLAFTLNATNSLIMFFILNICTIKYKTTILGC